MAALLATGRDVSTFCKLQEFHIILWYILHSIFALYGTDNTSTAAPSETGDLPRPVACLQQWPVADIKGRACG